MKPLLQILILSLFPFILAAEPAAQKIKIGVLAFGTVNWELAAMHNEGLDRSHQLDLEIQTLASPEAGKIALQAGGVDLIVTDWIWVANQRQNGAEFRFIPYSTHAGALIVPADSNIRSVADLPGKKLGIVGGGLDKNWILLRAFAQVKNGIDLDKTVEKVFGAPPLLNQQMAQGKLDALLNFWHYAAKLEAQGYRRVLDGRDVLKGLDIAEPMPNLGYVFKASWAAGHEATLDAFLKASRAARTVLCSNDNTWSKVVSLTQEKDEKIQAALRHEYCTGVVKSWGEPEKQAAARIYAILHQTGGEQLTGKADKLPEDIFWPYELGR